VKQSFDDAETELEREQLNLIRMQAAYDDHDLIHEFDLNDNPFEQDVERAHVAVAKATRTFESMANLVDVVQAGTHSALELRRLSAKSVRVAEELVASTKRRLVTLEELMAPAPGPAPAMAPVPGSGRPDPSALGFGRSRLQAAANAVDAGTSASHASHHPAGRGVAYVPGLMARAQWVSAPGQAYYASGPRSAAEVVKMRHDRKRSIGSY
jgi:hypothetical protein